MIESLNPIETPISIATHEIKRLMGGDLPKRFMFEEYRSNPEWYANQEMATGIHGIGHAARVMVWQEILATIMKVQKHYELDNNALRWAAAIHDSQRVDDHDDRRHGERAYRWIKNHFPITLETKSLAQVEYLAKWHVPADGMTKMSLALKIFKDADGLDRIRLDDLDPRYLRMEESRNLLVPLAEELYCLSTFKENCSQKDQFTVVMEAAIQMGIIAKA